MRRFTGIFTFFALVLSSNFALAATPYFSAQFGGSFIQDSDLKSETSTYSALMDTSAGINFAVATGVKWDYFRTDIEFAYTTMGADKLITANDAGLGAAVGLGSLSGLTSPLDGDVNSFSVMLNGYIDFNNSSNLTPYFLFGIGASNIDYDEISTSSIILIDDSDTSLAYKFGLGFSYKLAAKLDFTLSYHYLTVEDLELSDVRNGFIEPDYDSHNLNLGVRVSF